jgi:hypothetical protein
MLVYTLTAKRIRYRDLQNFSRPRFVGLTPDPSSQETIARVKSELVLIESEIKDVTAKIKRLTREQQQR